MTPRVRRFRLEDHVGVLLCSDGLSDMIQDDEMSAVLAEHPTDPAAHLVAAALDAGGKDNVTVIVIGPRSIGA